MGSGFWGHLADIFAPRETPYKTPGELAIDRTKVGKH